MSIVRTPSSAPIKGVYTTSSELDFEGMEEKGVTDVFCTFEDTFQRNTPSCISTLETVLSAIESSGTNIKLHMVIRPLMGSDGAWKLPENPLHQNTIKNSITTIIGEYSAVSGLSFDDYNIQLSQYVPRERSTQQTNLQNFTREIYTHLHDTRSDLKLSAAMYYADAWAASVELEAPYLDYVISQVYRLPTQMPSSKYTLSESHDWVKNTLPGIIDAASPTLVLPALINYQSDITHIPYPMRDIKVDIKNVLNLGVRGYVFFALRYGGDDFWLPFRQNVRRGGATRSPATRT